MHKLVASTQKRFSRYICVPTCIHMCANYSDSFASQRKFLPTACLVPCLLSEISFCVERPWRKSKILIKPHMQPDCSLSYRTGRLCDFFAMVINYFFDCNPNLLTGIAIWYLIHLWKGMREYQPEMFSIQKLIYKLTWQWALWKWMQSRMKEWSGSKYGLASCISNTAQVMVMITL